MNQLFRREMQQRGAMIVKARRASSAMSTARAIVDHVHDLHHGTRPGEFVSMGVWSDHGAYGLQPELIFSVPVICQGHGRYQVNRGELGAVGLDGFQSISMVFVQFLGVFGARSGL